MDRREKHKSEVVHLRDTEKLAVLDKMVSKVAHELNAPLDGILRYINLTLRIIETQPNMEKPVEYLSCCRQGLIQMSHIIDELLEYSRNENKIPNYAPVENIIEAALALMSARAKSLDVEFRRNYNPNLPKIRSDNLFQVFCNLTKNALDAMPDSGLLTITTRRDNDTIIVEFRDTGIGLPAGHIKDIFQPFFTTKYDENGTGLGLAICKDIVESYKGKITAENAPDKGCIFKVFLPIENE